MITKLFLDSADPAEVKLNNRLGKIILRELR